VGRKLTQVYVALGSGGLVKVGYTVDLKARTAQLRREFRAKGEEMVRIQGCERIPHARIAEYRLIDHCRKHYTTHSGWEWFVNAGFDDVLAVAAKVSAALRDFDPPPYVPMAAEELLALKERHQREKAAAQERRLAALAATAKRAKVRQLMRCKAERVIDSLIAFAIGRSTPSEA
jgi:hypothetical protein